MLLKDSILPHPLRISFLTVFVGDISVYSRVLILGIKKTMDKTLETLMGWSLAIGVPLLIYYLQDSAAARKHRRDIAIQQAVREMEISKSVDALKSTVDRSATVLDNIENDVIDIRERLVRVETRISP